MCPLAIMQGDYSGPIHGKAKIIEMTKGWLEFECKRQKGGQKSCLKLKRWFEKVSMESFSSTLQHRSGRMAPAGWAQHEPVWTMLVVQSWRELLIIGKTKPGAIIASWSPHKEWSW